MRYPQIVVCSFDEWVANQLRVLAGEQRWVLRDLRQPRAALDLLREGRPTVQLVQVDPTSPRPEPLRLVAETHRLFPEVVTVVLSDAKLPEEDRAAWTASVFDLGARYVLFPPLSRPILEDLVGGLMAAIIRRTGGEPPARPGAEEPAIDLAERGYEDE